MSKVLQFGGNTAFKDEDEFDGLDTSRCLNIKCGENGFSIDFSSDDDGDSTYFYRIREDDCKEMIEDIINFFSLEGMVRLK